MTARLISFPSLRLELQQALPTFVPCAHCGKGPDEPEHGPECDSIIDRHPYEQMYAVEPMAIPVEWMRYCEICDRERCFIARFRAERGFVARCTSCGTLRLAPYTRTNSDSTAWEAYT